MTLDLERTLITCITIVGLMTLTYLSGFRSDLVTVLMTGLGWVLGYWLGQQAAPAASARGGNGPS